MTPPAPKWEVRSRRVLYSQITSITPGGFLLVYNHGDRYPRMYAQDGSMIARDGKRIRNPRRPAPSWWRDA